LVKRSGVALGAIVVVGAALRAYNLGAQSLWIDELEEGHTARAALPKLFEYVRADAGGVPLDYLGVRLTTTIFGGGTVGTRLWALTMGCLAIVVIFFVAQAWFASASAGLAAAALLALSPFHIYYSREARPYALSALAVVVLLLLYHHALGKRDLKRWLLFGGALGIALYAHYFLALLVIPAAIVLAVFRWGEWRRSGVEALNFTAGMALAALLFAPWVLYSSLGQLHDLGWPPPPPLDLHRLFQIFDTLLGLGALGLAQAPSGDFGPLHKREALLTVSVLLAATAGLVLELRRGRYLVLLAALVPLLAIPVAWAADQRQHYFWSERQVIFVLPCVYLLAAVAVARIASLRALARMAPAAAVAALVLWAALSFGSIEKIYQGQWLPKADWRDASAFAASRSRADTRVYSFLNDQFAYGVAYYQPQLEPRGRTVDASPQGLAGVDLKPDDLVVAQPDASLAELLASRSFSYRDFAGGIRIYFHPD
jgi:4-amino-4-deoxy-L-arabinose transferase-like glycosyltransferase